MKTHRATTTRPAPPISGAIRVLMWPTRPECCTASRSIACCRSSARVMSTSSRQPTSPRWLPRSPGRATCGRRSPRASRIWRRRSTMRASSRIRLATGAREASARGARRARAAARRTRRGHPSAAPEDASVAAVVARLVGRPCRLCGRRAGGRLRRAAPSRAATRRPHGCSWTRGRTRFARRPRRCAGRSGSRCSRRTTCATAGSRCYIAKAALGLRSERSSGSAPRV